MSGILLQYLCIGYNVQKLHKLHLSGFDLSLRLGLTICCMFSSGVATVMVLRQHCSLDFDFLFSLPL